MSQKLAGRSFELESNVCGSDKSGRTCNCDFQGKLPDLADDVGNINGDITLGTRIFSKC